MTELEQWVTQFSVQAEFYLVWEIFETSNRPVGVYPDYHHLLIKKCYNLYRYTIP